MSDNPFGNTSALPPAGPRPWGLLGTIVWGVAGFCAWFAAQFAVIVAYVATHEAVDAQALATNGLLLALVTIISGPVWIAIMAFAAHQRGWRVPDYLALVVPRRGEIVFGFACMAALLIAFDLLTLAFGRDVVPAFMFESYKTARASGSLLPFLVAVVIIGPVTEEVVFRGFLFRG